MGKKINIAELLKDCPRGMELDCAMYEDVYFDYVDELNIIHCHIPHTTHTTSLVFNQYGTPNRNGNYLITYRYFECNPKYVTIAIREGDSWYSPTYDRLRLDVLAWYPIDNIKPYKE